jgi:hypothetical protein
MSNLPILLAIGCFAVAWFAWRSPREIILSDSSIEIGQPRGNRIWPLAELSMAIVTVVPFTSRRKLKLFDRGGRAVAVISDSIERFDELVRCVQGELQRREDDQVSMVRRRKGRRQAVLLAGMGIVFTSLLTGLFIMSRADAESARLLQAQGQPAMATILRHFTAPDGRTRRIEYRVTDASGISSDHNVEVDPAIWAVLEGVKAISVVTVPGRPDIAQLSIGEIKDEMNASGGMQWLLLIGGGIMCVFFFVAAVLNWRGIDIDLDSRTGKLSIKRFGTGQ